MKVAVCAREIRPNEILSPDRAGMEAAVRLKQQNEHISVTFICLGSLAALPLIRTALSLGCDQGILLQIQDSATPDAAASASILAAYLKSQTFDLILTSCFAVDSDTIQTGVQLAARLRLPYACYAKEVMLNPASPDNTDFPNHSEHIFVVKQQETRRCLLDFPLPCLLSVMPRPDQPVYPTVSGISRAYQAPVLTVPIETFLKESGMPAIQDLLRVQVCSKTAVPFCQKGRILTVSSAASADEAVSAILDLIRKHHILP